MPSAIFLAVIAAGASALTLFSGFGLGTLLLPVFAIFFPLPVAVAATAVVHVLNNLLKTLLLARHAVLRVVLAFGLPAIPAAFLGAKLLAELADESARYVWRRGPFSGEVTPVGFVLGILIVVFGILEFARFPRRFTLSPKILPLGGVLAGFSGGLSGHQGALRAVFLGRLGLEATAFVATQAILACLIDFSRLCVYGTTFLAPEGTPILLGAPAPHVIAATIGALIGTLIGRRFLPKVTVGVVRRITGALLLVVGTGLASGVL